MSITRFLFVNAINTQESIETFIPNLGLGYIASSIRKEGISIREHTVEFKVIDDNIVKAIKSWNPDLIGITAVSQNYTKAIEYAKIAKGFKLPVIMGGVHISALPETLTANMDIGVIGEGERTVTELIRLFQAEGKFNVSSLNKIDGIVFHGNNGAITTRNRGLIQPLDSIPFPARDILRISKSTSMFSSRGCPYRCTFCFSSRFWNKVRFFSAEYVVEEIEFLYKTYKVKQISFLDDLFIADKNRLASIIELLSKKNLLGKISYRCNVRSNLVTDDIARMLCLMGVDAIGMGLESGCQSTLEYLKGKGNITVEDHVRAIQILRGNKILPHVSFIIGSPFEGRDSILETIKFIEDNGITTNFDVFVLMPFPGTPIWDYALSRSLVSNNMDWNRLEVKFNCNLHPIIVSDKLTEQEIRVFYNQLINRKEQYIARYASRGLLLRGIKAPWKIPRYIRRCANVFSHSGL
jgi:anaerobic magnesium-protoporphyrin IX monomethyl ester cyclase